MLYLRLSLYMHTYVTCVYIYRCRYTTIHVFLQLIQIQCTYVQTHIYGKPTKTPFCKVSVDQFVDHLRLPQTKTCLLISMGYRMLTALPGFGWHWLLHWAYPISWQAVASRDGLGLVNSRLPALIVHQAERVGEFVWRPRLTARALIVPQKGWHKSEKTGHWNLSFRLWLWNQVCRICQHANYPSSGVEQAWLRERGDANDLSWVTVPVFLIVHTTTHAMFGHQSFGLTCCSLWLPGCSHHVMEARMLASRYRGLKQLMWHVDDHWLMNVRRGYIKLPHVTAGNVTSYIKLHVGFLKWWYP